GPHAPRGRVLARAQRLERWVLLLRHRQELVEAPRRRGDGERVRELHGGQVHGGRDAQDLEQPQLLDRDRGLRAQQRHLRLAPRYLRLPHVDERGAPDVVTRVRELQKLLVAVEPRLGQPRVLARLPHRQILLGDAVDERGFGAGDVGVGRRELRVLQTGLTQRRARQLPAQAEVVARGPGGDVLREALSKEGLLARPRVPPACGRRHRWKEVRVGVAHAPRCRATVVQRLAVGRIVLVRNGDRVGEGEGRGDRSLALGWKRAQQEPDGEQRLFHRYPGGRVVRPHPVRANAVCGFEQRRRALAVLVAAKVAGRNEPGQAAGRRP